jgi:hypothetical protein
MEKRIDVAPEDPESPSDPTARHMLAVKKRNGDGEGKRSAVATWAQTFNRQPLPDRCGRREAVSSKKRASCPFSAVDCDSDLHMHTRLANTMKSELHVHISYVWFFPADRSFPLATRELLCSQ